MSLPIRFNNLFTDSLELGFIFISRNLIQLVNFSSGGKRVASKIDRLLIRNTEIKADDFEFELQLTHEFEFFVAAEEQ